MDILRSRLMNADPEQIEMDFLAFLMDPIP